MHRRWALIAVLALAACQPSASESVSPSEGASAAPSASAAADTLSGTITLAEGAAVDGPGLSIPEALETAGEEPLLVNGILLQDTEGTIWLCESLSDGSPRACADSQLQVENWPEDDTATLDPANADDTGLQEEDGVVWIEDYQAYGTVSPSM
jgi:hypothetical protein